MADNNPPKKSNPVREKILSLAPSVALALSVGFALYSLGPKQDFRRGSRIALSVLLILGAAPHVGHIVATIGSDLT
jgi:hypothetical protein